MKNSFKQIREHRHYNKALYWGKLISMTGGAQIVVQICGLITGFVIVNLLPVQEYAMYTIANTMLGTMMLLADGGITTGIMAEGGKVWSDKTKLGMVLSTGLNLRRKFAIGSLLVCLPVLIYLLYQHDAGLITCLLIGVSVIPSFLSSLSDTVYQVTPKLYQDIKPLQKNQLIVSLGRFFLNGALLAFLPFTFIALIANAVPQIYGNFRMKKVSDKFADLVKESDKETEKAILRVVKRVMPGAIYYSISGQLTIWLISFFGNTTSLASFGALGRISSVTNVVIAIFSTLFIPRFARLVNDKAVLVKTFLVNQLLLFVVCLLMVAFVYLFSGQILFLLGKDYEGLDYELVLIMISSCIALVSTCTNGLLLARSLTVPPVLFIACTILVQFLGLFIFPVSSIEGVVFYGMSTTAVIYIFRLIYFYYTIKTNKIS